MCVSLNQVAKSSLQARPVQKPASVDPRHRNTSTIKPAIEPTGRVLGQRAGQLAGQLAGQSLVENSKHPSTLWDRAQKTYPILRGVPMGFVVTPDEDRGVLEFFDKTEPGSPENPRPPELPFGTPGIQVFDPATKESDVLADWTSHWGVKTDPRLKRLYEKFTKSLDPEWMKKRHQSDKKDRGEKRPYQQWFDATGAPGVFRGYTFDQWDKRWNDKVYTSEQIGILDEVRKHVGYKGRPWRDRADLREGR